MLNSKIKVRLAELNNMKQNDFANKLGVKPQTLSGWATGKNHPSLEQAFKIAKYLDCKVDDLWTYEE